MPQLHLRPSTRRRWRTVTRLLLLCLLVVFSIDLVMLLRSNAKPDTRPPAQLLQDNELPSVFIASINAGAASDVPHAWRRAVESVAAHLASDKVHVSVYQVADEKGSRNELEQLQRDLDLLGVQHSITFANDENINAFNQTWTAQALSAPPPATAYVHHMAEMRNRVLRPMIELALQGTRFDRILFVESAPFSDVRELLSTRHGAFGAACALDLDASGRLCETIALRDSEGHGPIVWKFPYFRSEASRNAAIAEEAIPVLSCWSGLGQSFQASCVPSPVTF
ncbi:hypothetical protein MMC26_007403 [Xylographa opegraphella]|nr:hypothetical protein [Xylographa opegraphella]